MEEKTLDDLTKEYPWIGKKSIEIVKSRIKEIIGDDLNYNNVAEWIRRVKERLGI